MVSIKMSEIYVYIGVFIFSLALFFTFLALANQTQDSEQVYEMTDHQLNDKYVIEQVPHEHERMDAQTMMTTTVNH
ncbi:DNA damage-induced cell division inhibitor SosA [Staphylococcus felis]|uniref:DNA damage-induced cell division inhibitor SosA n=1 Tax=Staphylococcus felis TaxID=46127 RepID=UPI0021D32288|nr:DNA damage-induced cell division inhibitor SosA [Staphylococcus felis]UXR85868.1 hypothetical protein MUA17_07350 [Staphylococcus felis]